MNLWTTILGTCPCEFPNNRNCSDIIDSLSADSGLTICTSHENDAQLSSLLSGAITTDKLRFISPYRGIDSAANYTCDVILEVLSNAPTSSTSRELCPQRCSPNPILYFAHFLLSHDEHNWESFKEDYAPVCSLNVKSDLLFDWKSNKIAQAKYRSFQAYLLFTLAWRRYLECREDVSLSTYAKSAHFSDSSRPSKQPPAYFTHIRRKVLSVVIWIGSQQNYHIMENQALMLHQETYHASLSSVIGWAATDELYPSRPGSAKCLSSNKRYAGYLTNSAVNFMPKGWGRAQRRPLRALSHVLLLFDPEFIVIADDDTLFNFPLFRMKYLPMLLPPHGNWSQHAMIIGEMMGRTGLQGHLSVHGMFIGGSGYILNRPLLQQLHGNKIHSFGLTIDAKQSLSSDYITDDPYRSKSHIWHLSVLREGIEMASKFCPEASPKSCVVINEADLKPTSSEKTVGKGGIAYVTPNGRNEQIELAVRVVDFCANLMANEHTCQHRYL